MVKSSFLGCFYKIYFSRSAAKKTVMWIHFVVILVIFLAWHGTVVLGASDEERLIDYLLNSTRYDPASRPVVSYSDVIVVRHSTEMAQLVKLDEKNQVITTSTKIRLEWQDPNLLWEPLTYGGIKEMNIDLELIWSPKLGLLNDADGSVEEIATPRAIVQNSGKVSAVFPRILKSTCKINVKDFPFDRQVCGLKFGSSRYALTQMDLQPITDHIDTSSYHNNGEWHLSNTRATREIIYHAFSETDGFVQLSYVMALDRKPLYYICNFLLPIVLIEIITILLFLIPPQTGEQMAVGVTILLSQAVFFLLLEDKMPETSDYVPLIGKYYACCIMEVAMAVGAICLVLRLHHHEATEVPLWMKKYILGYVAHALNISVKPKKFTKKSIRQAFLKAQKHGRRNEGFEAEEKPQVAKIEHLEDTWEFKTEEIAIVKPRALIWMAKVELARRKRRKLAEEGQTAWKSLAAKESELLKAQKGSKNSLANGAGDESEDDLSTSEFDTMEGDDISIFERFIRGLQESDMIEKKQEEKNRENGIPPPTVETSEQKQKRSLRLMAENIRDERKSAFMKRQWQMVGKVVNYVAMLLYIIASIVTFLVCFGSTFSGVAEQKL